MYGTLRREFRCKAVRTFTLCLIKQNAAILGLSLVRKNVASADYEGFLARPEAYCCD